MHNVDRLKLLAPVDLARLLNSGGFCPELVELSEGTQCKECEKCILDWLWEEEKIII